MSDVEIRRNEIIELLYTYKKYSIDDFAKRFGVSRRTINYDIVYLIFFVTSRQRASSFGLRLFFFVLVFKLFITLPKAER